MRSLASALALPILLAEGDAVKAQQTDDSALAQAVQSMNANLPRQMGNGVRWNNVTLHGRTVVLSVSGLPDWRPTGQEAVVKRAFDTLCTGEKAQRLFSAGVQVVIDATSPSGAQLPLIRLCQWVR